MISTLCLANKAACLFLGNELMICEGIPHSFLLPADIEYGR